MAITAIHAINNFFIFVYDYMIILKALLFQYNGERQADGEP